MNQLKRLLLWKCRSISFVILLQLIAIAAVAAAMSIVTTLEAATKWQVIALLHLQHPLHLQLQYLIHQHIRLLYGAYGHVDVLTQDVPPVLPVEHLDPDF